MSEQLQLIECLRRLRDALDQPTSMSLARQEAVRRLSRKLEDQCCYYIGWHAAQADNSVPRHVASSLIARADRLAGWIVQRKKKTVSLGRRAGSDTLWADLIIVGIMLNHPGTSLVDVVKAAMARGLLPSIGKITDGKAVTAEGHAARIRHRLNKDKKRIQA